jgi:hypothetical protein
MLFFRKQYSRPHRLRKEATTWLIAKLWRKPHRLARGLFASASGKGERTIVVPSS